MDWKDIEVGDYISVRTNNTLRSQILSGVVTHIKHYNRATDTTPDPLVYYFSDDYYEIALKMQQAYDGTYFREILINSLFCTLINILKKGDVSTMPLEIGKQYKVTVPKDYSDPGTHEFTGKLVKINKRQHLTHLVYSEELEKQKQGHYGDGYTNDYGCWYCKPEWLKETEELEPTIKLEDLF
jgi:hypothetical protein